MTGSSFKKLLKIFIPVIIGAGIVVYSYISYSPTERNLIYDQITSARLEWVLLSMFIALLSHFSRAYRWRYMQRELGFRPKLADNIIAIGIGYATNLIIPRGGEFARAATIKKTDGMPLDKSIGTIIAERVIDLAILMGILLIAMGFAQSRFRTFLSSKFTEATQDIDTYAIVVYVLIACIVIALLFLLVKKLGFLKKVTEVLGGIKEGFATIWKMEKKGLYLLHTIFIWSSYLLMFYTCSLAVEGATSISMAALLAAFVSGSFAVALINGGFGAYPVFVAQTLLLFEVPEVVGTSLGWVLWISQTVLVILYGAASFVGLSVKNL